MKPGDKIQLKKHPNITGVIIEPSHLGFNHFLVQWDRTKKVIREYGSDLEKTPVE